MNKLIKNLTFKQIEDLKNEIIQDINNIKNYQQRLEEKCNIIEKYLYARISRKVFEKRDYGKFEDDLNASCWKYFINISNIKKVMTKKAELDLNKQIEENKMNFTEKDAHITFDFMSEKYGDSIKQTIKEVYNDLICIKYRKGHKFVQNNINKIEKIFRFCGYNIQLDWKGNYRSNISHYSWLGKSINDIEIACCLLDGKIKKQYPNTIEDKINNSENQNIFENEYFILTIYKNGNRKIEFKNLDVLEKLNQYGSGLLDIKDLRIGTKEKRI